MIDKVAEEIKNSRDGINNEFRYWYGFVVRKVKLLALNPACHIYQNVRADTEQILRTINTYNATEP